MRFYRYAAAISLGLILMSGCSYDVSQKGAYMKNYHEALKKTDPQAVPSPQPGSPEEKQAVDRFKDFYRVFSAEKIRQDVKALYRQDAYFREGSGRSGALTPSRNILSAPRNLLSNARSTSRMWPFTKAITISAGS
jgi:hypothetical protein